MWLCIVFSVFTVTPSKIEMQTSQYRKSRIWEMKRKINIAKASTRIRSVRNAVLVSLWGHNWIWPLKTNRNICFWVFLRNAWILYWGTHKDQNKYNFKSYIYSETRNVKRAKSQKNGKTFLTQIIANNSFPESSIVLYCKTKNPFEPKICKCC